MASDNKVVSVLKEARRLIDEVGWTQGAWARTAAGRTVGPETSAAACFCSLGAIRRAASSYDEAGRAHAALDVVVDDAVSFNDADGRTKAEVLDAFSRAIAQTEGR